MTEFLTVPPAEFARRRAGGMQALGDQTTRETLMHHVVVKPGASCAFIGSALCEVAQWIRHRVGDNATVMVFDRDLTLLKADASRRYGIHKHDLMSGPLPGELYDFIHFRGEVDSVPYPERAIAYLTQSLAPDGVLVGEVADWHTALHGHTTAPMVLTALDAAIQCLVSNSDYHPGLWTDLPDFMRNSGLQAVVTESHARTIGGGTPETDLLYVTLVRAADTILTSGRLSRALLDSALQSLKDPDFRMTSPSQFFASGQLLRAPTRDGRVSSPLRR